MNARSFALSLKKFTRCVLVTIVFMTILASIASYGFVVKWCNEHKTQVVSYWIPENHIEVTRILPDEDKIVLLSDPNSFTKLADSNSVVTVYVNPPVVQYFLGVGSNYVSGPSRQNLCGDNYGMSTHFKWKSLEPGKVQFTYHLSYMTICFGIIGSTILGLCLGTAFAGFIYLSVKTILSWLFPTRRQAAIRKRWPWFGEAQAAWRSNGKA